MSSTVSADLGARRAALRRAYIAACRGELEALKPGNVHIHAAGHGMSVEDFRVSARVSAAPLTVPGGAVGRRILEAVAATREAVGCNTNLGIVLLAAPLLAAAEGAARCGLRASLAGVLARLTVADAVAAYEAIRLAAPAGLGRVAEQDAAATPTIDLRQAMALAAGRDSIARQYATDYAGVFDIGVAGLRAQQAANVDPKWATSHIYMNFLATFPDSHILRKHGTAAAEMARAEAAALVQALAHAAPDGRRAALLAFDQSLKQRGLNPGSSADLTVASLLALACENILSSQRK
ncbi:MAG TPA: triphosphoribosyl-dephospho-CoA synthase [Stellaceae bacterium]|nr:triphosphoribosyl-dephospho-CoA synthase [Stellaceae bacterium]